MTQILSTSLFLWHDHSFVAEDSDLRARGFDLGLACRQGVTLRSHKTGELALFRYDSTQRDPREGEILSWTFKPATAALQGCLVRIFND